MKRVVEIFQVDAFTTRPFGGNPAGVALDAEGLSDAEMRKIAAEMNVAETAFVWQAGLLTVNGDVAAFQAEQGDFLGRPGRLRVELHMVDGQPARVRVGGQAVTVISGSIRVE